MKGIGWRCEEGEGEGGGDERGGRRRSAHVFFFSLELEILI